MELFPGTPPPLPPILDVAALWNAANLRSIAAARAKLEKRFPQFIWKICTVELDPTQSIDMFAFWMMNASPLMDGEAAEDRGWTVLLLIDVANEKATLAPGYAAEGWLAEDEWRRSLRSMANLWESGKTTASIARYFTTLRKLLEQSWRRLPPI